MYCSIYLQIWCTVQVTIASGYFIITDSIICRLSFYIYNRILLCNILNVVPLNNAHCTSSIMQHMYYSLYYLLLWQVNCSPHLFNSRKNSYMAIIVTILCLHWLVYPLLYFGQFTATSKLDITQFWSVSCLPEWR